MSNKHKVNPITQELLAEGVLEFKSWEKPRRVVDVKTGEERIEIVTYTKSIDRRQFTKAFHDRWLVFYKMYEGNPKAQMLFIIEHLVAKSINKDYIFISYKDFVKMCTDSGLESWKQPQFSKILKMFIDNNLLIKSEEFGKYFFNTRYFYNGSLSVQIGGKDNE